MYRLDKFKVDTVDHNSMCGEKERFSVCARIDKLNHKEMSEEFEEYEPTINNLLQKDTLKWIFVGGKGGVGKTTTSCSVAIQLAKVKESVLLISTDPAHNLSDAFSQKFTKTPTRVNGFDNLYCMEIDPTPDQDAPEFVDKQKDMFNFQEIAMAIPGIDEAMSFAEVMKLVQTMKYSVIVFDTAPTGHTLRLLSIPSLLDKAMGKFMDKNFTGIFSSLSGVMGSETSPQNIESKMQENKKIIEEVNTQFKNPEMTTFVPVCIPEFLSLYETERLIQQLTKLDMDVQNIVVNQIVYPESDCGLCQARRKMQQKYIDQINELYMDFHVTKMPLLKAEVRGTPSLSIFSQLLVEPYDGTKQIVLPNQEE
ncbi:arsenite transport subunit A [Cavenderia fasciculata]|uniref:ATPase ASNA1 homolog n=1 Tax=Cavenderia fasciculata TaxID=261658 RepID=F4Q897_CACFS|nr:arsenite transport subunit A [Cavenderia fasciculata]EGG15997.1 arsenite transport subunit A [Cavenderia fasciculata]|eukprot:XP_004352322.1 arsenite transport subunit A [Cavenderia fasciculata]